MIMTRPRPHLSLQVLAVVSGLSVPAVAAPRTFVSATGSDLNPCTLVAPCRTFAVALGVTDPGGELIALSSAGYGTASITQAVSIIAAPGVNASVSVVVGFGIDVNAGPND